MNDLLDLSPEANCYSYGSQWEL